MKIINSNVIMLVVFTLIATVFSEFLVYAQLKTFWQYEQNHEMVYYIGFYTSLIDAFLIIYLIIVIKNIYEKNLESKIEIAVEESNKLKERLELALLGNHDGVWDWNIITNEVYLSPRWKEILGFSDDELESKFSVFVDYCHPDDLQNVLNAIQENIDGKTEYFESKHRLKHKDGHWVWILDRGKAIFCDNGKAVRMIGTHTDISMEKKLQLKQLQQGKIIEQVNDSVITTDLDGNIVSWNTGSEKMLGYSAIEVIGKNMSIIHRSEDIEENKEYANRLITSGAFNVNAYLVKKSKELVYASISLSLLRDENDNITGLIGISHDITQRKKDEEKLLEQRNTLEYQAHHDPLTGLPNRILFNDRLEQAIEKAKRNGTKIALLFIDLDHFKEINDSLGHEIGDKVLKATTNRLSSIIRAEDTLARLGGDEFTVILEDLKQGQSVSLLATKIIEILEQPVTIKDNVLYISASIGISIYPDDSTSTQSLLKFADSAMYKAKDEGRKNFQFYSSEMTERAFERVLMETSLRASLKNEDFVVYYQPQVNGTNDGLIGMEALVRWQHPSMGLVSPAKFIPLAESIGLIVELDRFVMKTAMTQIATWYKEGLNPGILAMNLAIKQLQQKDFLDTLKNLIDETGCKAQWLELEITESKIMTNPEEAIKILTQISDLGIELAIDDFGTGYSSLSYLKRLPIDKLKIDQDFVRDLPDDDEDAGITKAVIALAKSLNLRVIAEGVETKEQRNFLVENGCENIQGYYYSKPIPVSELEDILLNGFNI